MTDSTSEGTAGTPREWGEGEEWFNDVCDYVNATPPLASLLYEVDLMPEQIDLAEGDGDLLFAIVNHWRENELENERRLRAAEASKTVKKAKERVIALLEELTTAHARIKELEERLAEALELLGGWINRYLEKLKNGST